MSKSKWCNSLVINPKGKDKLDRSKIFEHNPSNVNLGLLPKTKTGKNVNKRLRMSVKIAERSS